MSIYACDILFGAGLQFLAYWLAMGWVTVFERVNHHGT